MAPKGTGGYSPAQRRKPTLFTIEDIKDLGNYFYDLFERSNLKWVVYLAAFAALSTSSRRFTNSSFGSEWYVCYRTWQAMHYL
jgi:hypothetical protein